MPQPAIPGGYILIARKLLESGIMSKPPLYLKLWAWMIGKANWKDRDKLKRGQFVTTIAEMQEAMSYYAGYRKITPTKDEIRSAYGAFTEASMVTTTKTTRGMVVTVLNYETYQNPESYGPHTGPHDGDTPEPTATPHDTKEGLKKNLKPSSTEALRLSALLADLILQSNPGNRSLKEEKKLVTVEKWAVDIDRIIRLDKRAPEEVERVIRWCQAHSFWKGNIMSGDKLRAQFDRLTVQMQQGEGKSEIPRTADQEPRKLRVVL